MRKILIPVLLMLCAVHPALAQKSKPKKATEIKPYFRAGLGYALPHGGAARGIVNGYSYRQLLPVNGSTNTTVTSSNFSETFDLKNTSYSSGVHGVVAMGVFITRHIGIELSADLGLSTQKAKASTSESDANDNVWFNTTQQCKLPVMITPAIVLQTGGKINVYSRAGLAIPIQAEITQEASYTNDRLNPATNTFIRYRTIAWTEDYKMRLSPGFTGAMGIKYNISKNIALSGEIGMLSLSLYYKSSELTSFEQTDVNGSYNLGDLTPAQRSSQYEFKGTTTNNSHTYPTSQVSFSNFNLMAGIHIDL